MLAAHEPNRSVNQVMSNKHSEVAADELNLHCQFPASAFRQACRELDLFRYLVQAILLSGNETVIGEWGGDPALAAQVVERVRRTFDTSYRAVQLHYTRLSDPDRVYLLYVMPADGHLLVLVASSEQPIKNVRLAAQTLADVVLANGSRTKPTAVESRAPTDNTFRSEVENSYAIAWRPVEPMPRAMRRIVVDSTRRLAVRKGCFLNFVGVASDHVHLVLQCPSRRKSSWAAYEFKRGIEEDIAQRYGITASLWQKGFLAAQSSEPIDSEALLVYLSHQN